jgi:multidrug efflux pump subunit AcrA (membrane-fusion protein)
MMKKIAIAGTVVVLAAMGAFAAFQFLGSPGQETGTPVAQAAEELQVQPLTDQLTDQVVVDGRVVPVQTADLSLPTGGIVAQVLVSEGQQVEAGQVLLRLQATQQEAALQLARAQLDRAQAQLVELQASARDQELANAQAVLDGAQARLDRVQNGPLSGEIQAAQAALAEAQASLQGVVEGPSDEQLIAAETELANAQAVLRQAQAAYDRVAGNPDIGARPEAVQLEQATNTANAASARLADLKAGARASDIAAARARVQRAQAQLDVLTASNPADVAEAEAAVRQAQAQLDLLQAGVRTETIAVAESEVKSAQAAVAQAEAALADTQLLAPFAGTVAALDVNVGESLSAGTPVITLADLTRWQIETEDLTEFDAVAVQPGGSVCSTFDALPDRV